MNDNTLTRTQVYLLHWLGGSDSSAYGECRGQDLDVLVAKGLVEIGPQPTNHTDENYRPVTLTAEGIAAAAEKQRDPTSAH